MKNTFSNNPTKTMNFDNVQTAANWFNAFFKLGRRPPKSLGEAEAIFMAVDDKLNKSTQPGTAARIGSFFGMGEKQLKGGSRSRSRKNRRRSYRK